jgi:flagellar M-ring protein FliF
MDISSKEDAVAMQEMETEAFYLELARYGLVGLALLLLVWFVLRPMSRSFVNQGIPSGATENGVGQGAEAGANQSANAVEAALNAMQLPAIGSDNLEQRGLQNITREMVTQDSRMATRIIQQWTRQT